GAGAAPRRESARAARRAAARGLRGRRPRRALGAAASPGPELRGRDGRRRSGRRGRPRARGRDTAATMTGPARAAPARLARGAARLGLHVRGRMGVRPGEQRFPGRPQPSGLEVEAHSAYMPGDDLRHLDWNLFGRLDTLLMRRFTAGREVVVHILVDASASMGTPAGDGKWAATAELAIVLAALARGSRHAARVVVLRDGASRASLVHRRRAGIAAMAELLDATTPAARPPPGRAVGEEAHRPSPGRAARILPDIMLHPAAPQRPP